MKNLTTKATLHDYAGNIADRNVTIDINLNGDYVMHGRVYPAADFEIDPNYGSPIMTHKAGKWSIHYTKSNKR